LYEVKMDKKKVLKPGDVKILMQTPDGIIVEVMRKKVDVKKSWGWKVVPDQRKEKIKTKEK